MGALDRLPNGATSIQRYFRQFSFPVVLCCVSTCKKLHANQTHLYAGWWAGSEVRLHRVQSMYHKYFHHVVCCLQFWETTTRMISHPKRLLRGLSKGCSSLHIIGIKFLVCTLIKIYLTCLTEGLCFYTSRLAERRNTFQKYLSRKTRYAMEKSVLRCWYDT